MKQNVPRFAVGLLAVATIRLTGCGVDSAKSASGQMMLAVGVAPIDTACAAVRPAHGCRYA